MTSKDIQTSQNAGFYSLYNPPNQRFYLQEKLKSAERIKEVFANGSAIKRYPILLFYKTGNFLEQTDFVAQAAFTVSKKKFKRAVDRNTIKRKLRECYRLQKGDFYAQHLKKQKPFQYQLVFVYIGNQLPTSLKVESAIKKILQQIAEN